MDAKEQKPDPAERFRAIALVLAVACALLAAAVLALILRAPPSASPPPQASSRLPDAPPAEEPSDRAPATPRRPSPLASAVNRAEIDTSPGMYRIDGQIQIGAQISVRRAAEEEAAVVAEIPAGTTVDLVARRSGWTLVSWPNGAGGVLIGWVVLPASAAGSLRTGGKIAGVVRLSGSPPVMKVPKKVKDAEFCKDHAAPYNAVVVHDGKLKDVFVRIENGGFQGKFPPSPVKARLDQVDCMYSPRIQGVMAGEEIEIRNRDGTLHNLHSYKGFETWFNQAQPKGSGPMKRELADPGIYKLTCDVHPWMRAFVVVTDHPFFAVSGEDGAFSIEGVPPGDHAVEAWHPRYGLKKARVTVGRAEATVDFTYTGNEPEPEENRDELKDLF